MQFNPPDMQIQVREIESADFEETIRLVERLYEDLGEEELRAESFAQQFLAELVQNSSSIVLVVKKFVTNEIITLATLTESKAIYASGRYGVLDEIFTLPKYRTNSVELSLQNQIREVAIEKGWGRIDIASPTDAWYRTVRFYKNQQLRLTVPKFKNTVALKAA